MGKKRSKSCNSSKSSTNSPLRNDDQPSFNYDASLGFDHHGLGATADETVSRARSMKTPFVSGSSPAQIPHKGSLCRIDSGQNSSSSVGYQFAIEILLENGSVHELRYEQQHYEFMSRLFAILDTESRGLVGRAALMEFVTLRCPVFWRRDNDVRRLEAPSDTFSGSDSPTFDEVWNAVASCSRTTKTTYDGALELGIEGWMVFCRFIALAQYLEAKRRFSARHLQQTMRHRNSPRGSELVVVDVPPPESPVPLSSIQLAEFERKVMSPLPLPELDLDHTLVAARDFYTYRSPNASSGSPGKVQISLFGSTQLMPSQLVSSSAAASFSSSNLEFAVTYAPGIGSTGEGSWGSLSMESIVVRRSFDDMKWLNDTFSSHRVLGGTLCGRILPPFPSSLSSYKKDENTRSEPSSGSGSAKMAIDAATAGVDILTSAAKSLWGNYVTPPSGSYNSIGAKAGPQSGKKSSSRSLAVSDSYYNACSPESKARQLERYLNYLLEHPALSTSFALNTILKASQSGIEAAKRSVRDHAHALHEQQAQAPQMENGRLSLFWTSSTPHHSEARDSVQNNLSWVRTAAQAAMALQVHGILETTGMSSASARLQHASLPYFDGASRNRAWIDDEDRQSGRSPLQPEKRNDLMDYAEGESRSASIAPEAENFESGVVEVASELGAPEGGDNEESDCADGYDLLPLPVPAPERRILCAGSRSTTVSRHPDEISALAGSEGRRSNTAKNSALFQYGSPVSRHTGDTDESQPTFLGDFAIDDDIDKLREVIGSVDNTLSRCLAACGGIGGGKRKALNLHLDVVRGFDSWEGFRGKIIAQRALLKGVAGLEQSRDVSEESDLELIEDISWQSSLASSAVTAAEDVRSTVRAVRTAANAKAAADAASVAAQNVCETGKFSSVDEARAAQTRASIAQSHAIHAAVVEHEAKTAKRRAALALANDVKCWNVHRKRELLRTCLRSARSQLEASRRAVDAWSCLRDGYVGSPLAPFTDTRRKNYSDHTVSNTEESATIFSDSIQHSGDGGGVVDSPSILPVDHNLLSNIEASEVEASRNTAFPEEESFHLPLSSSDAEIAEPETFAPSCTAEAERPEISNTIQPTDIVQSDETDVVVPSRSDIVNLEGVPEDTTEEKREEHEKLSASMQSLVDGLMAWGGQYDSEDDVALPTGMAASIAFEDFQENGMIGS